MNKQTELRLSGAGGQGLLLAGIILAEAALLDGKNAIQTQSYGPEARGGASKSEVIISEADIDYPKVRIPNLTLALTQKAADKYLDNLADDGIVIIDEKVEINGNLKINKIYKAPILKTAANKVGKSIVANIVALGMIVEATNVVTKEAIEQAVLSRVPKGTEDLNKKALSEGYKLVKE